MTSQSHPSHGAARRSKRPSTRPRDGVQSRAATGRGAGRACCGDSTSTGGAQDSTVTGSTRHVDRSINSSMSASRSARTQPNAASTAAESRTELRRECTLEAEAGSRTTSRRQRRKLREQVSPERSHGGIHTPVNPLENSNPQRERSGEDGDMK